MEQICALHSPKETTSIYLQTQNNPTVWGRFQLCLKICPWSHTIVSQWRTRHQQHPNPWIQTEYINTWRLDHKLTYDISRLDRITMVTLFNNAAGRYDRIRHNLTTLTTICMGCPKEFPSAMPESRIKWNTIMKLNQEFQRNSSKHLHLLT